MWLLVVTKVWCDVTTSSHRNVWHDYMGYDINTLLDDNQSWVYNILVCKRCEWLEIRSWWYILDECDVTTSSHRNMWHDHIKYNII